MSFRVSLAAHVAGPGQIVQHFAEFQALLPFQQTRLLRNLLALARPVPACVSASEPSQLSEPVSPAPRSPSNPARCAQPAALRGCAPPTPHAAGMARNSRQTPRTLTRRSPRLEPPAPKSSRKGDASSRQPPAARSGLASKKSRRPPWPETHAPGKHVPSRAGPDQSRDRSASQHARTRRHQAAADTDRSATQPSPRRLHWDMGAVSAGHHLVVQLHDTPRDSACPEIFLPCTTHRKSCQSSRFARGSNWSIVTRVSVRVWVGSEKPGWCNRTPDYVRSSSWPHGFPSSRGCVLGARASSPRQARECGATGTGHGQECPRSQEEHDLHKPAGAG